MTLQSAINQAKKQLIKKAQNRGIYENFGQVEVEKLREKFIDTSDYSPKMNANRNALNKFDDWCMTYTGN